MSIDWQFWLLSEEVRDWQAAALSVGIDPDSMKFHRDGWMAGPDARAIFESRSFRNSDQENLFDKRYRLVIAWASRTGDKVRYYNLKTVSLFSFARWCVDEGLTPLPPEFAALGIAGTPSTPERNLSSHGSKTPDDDEPIAKPGSNPPDRWQREARRIADRRSLQCKREGFHEGKEALAEFVEKDFRARKIEGPRRPLTVGNILREALQGSRWKPPA